MIITGFIENARNERCSDAEVVKLSQIFAELFPSFLADSAKSKNNNKWYCELIGGFSLTTTKTKSDQEFNYFTGSFESGEKKPENFCKNSQEKLSNLTIKTQKTQSDNSSYQWD